MKKLLLATVATLAFSAGAATVCSAAPARPAVGPSFNCAAPAVGTQPLAQLICSSDRIARADLSYIVAYMALRQISDDADRATMRTEANAFTARLTDECNIPKSGWLGGRSAFEMEVNCLVGKFDEERSRLLRRLDGEAMDEAQLTPEQTIAIQRLLKEKGFLPENALLDGVFGPATREAIGNWRRSNGQPSTGFGSAALLAGLQGSTAAATPAPARAPQSEYSQELLPEVADESIFGGNTDRCPRWNNPTQAKQILVYLIGAIAMVTEANGEIRKNMENGLAGLTEAQASHVRADISRHMAKNEEQGRLWQVCRDTIANALNLSDAAAQKLYEYNTQSQIHRQMFNDLREQHATGRDPDFSRLLAMPDRMEALHVLDLELREMNYSVRKFTEMVATATNSSTREMDQKLLARQISFRERLQALRSSIAHAAAAAPLLDQAPLLGKAPAYVLQPEPRYPQEMRSTGLNEATFQKIGEKIAPCWNIPANARNIPVEFDVTMNPDATPAKAELMDTSRRYNSDPNYRAAADAAYRAIMNPRCQPWPLVSGYRQNWKTMTLRLKGNW